MKVRKFLQYRKGIEEGFIYVKEKAKVVDAVWRTEFIYFLTALAVLHPDDMKKRMRSTGMM